MGTDGVPACGLPEKGNRDDAWANENMTKRNRIGDRVRLGPNGVGISSGSVHQDMAPYLRIEALSKY